MFGILIGNMGDRCAIAIKLARIIGDHGRDHDDGTISLKKKCTMTNSLLSHQ
jgi:hypothetical protein